jgi:predicted Zn finger-like uncharacterized protein
MFTLCPKCALTLVVTAADLRIAQGYVRCGRCLNVFNALSRLSEERPTAPPGSAPEPPPDGAADGLQEQALAPAEETPAPVEEAPEPSSTIDDTGEIEIELDASIFVTSVRPPAAPERAMQTEAQAEEAPAAAPVPAAPTPAATSAPVAPSPIATTPATAAPVTPAPAIPAPAIPAPVTPAPAVPAPVSTTPVTTAPPIPAPVTTAPATPASATPSAPEEVRQAAQTNILPQSLEGAFELRTRRPRADLAWRIGAGALVIALALQIVNHYRDALATHSALRGPLSAVYAALGVKLAPRWDIHAYDVRQLGASVAGASAGEIVVRASVKNSATRAQPLPLLRVTLQDRFGNRIAARDVPPGDYLPSSAAPSSLLAAGSRVDATMVFVDPGPQAVGFEIDACLRERSGAVACAHGP